MRAFSNDLAGKEKRCPRPPTREHRLHVRVPLRKSDHTVREPVLLADATVDAVCPLGQNVHADPSRRVHRGTVRWAYR